MAVKEKQIKTLNSQIMGMRESLIDIEKHVLTQLKKAINEKKFYLNSSKFSQFFSKKKLSYFKLILDELNKLLSGVRCEMGNLLLFAELEQEQGNEGTLNSMQILKTNYESVLKDAQVVTALINTGLFRGIEEDYEAIYSMYLNGNCNIKRAVP